MDVSSWPTAEGGLKPDCREGRGSLALRLLALAGLICFFATPSGHTQVISLTQTHAIEIFIISGWRDEARDTCPRDINHVI